MVFSAVRVSFSSVMLSGYSRTVFHVHLQAVGVGDALQEGGNGGHHPFAGGVGERPDGRFDACRFRDDVACGAGLQDADGQDDGVEHVELPRDHDLQGGHHFGGCGDGVLGRVRSGAVAAGAQDGDEQPVRGTEHHAGLGGELAVRLQRGEHVHAVGGVRAAARGVQDALADHVARAVVAFLAGLEHQHDVAGQLPAAFGQQGGGPGQHRGVEIMAAGVHGAVDPGGEVDAGALLDGEAVHVRAQQDHGFVGRSVRCAAAQNRGDRRRGLAEGDFVRQAVEGFENFLLGAREVQGRSPVPDATRGAAG